MDPHAAPRAEASALRWIAWVAAGVALMLLAAFLELSEDIFEAHELPPPVEGPDATVLRFVAQFRRPWLNGVAMDLTALGSPLVVTLFTIVACALLLAKADRAGAAVLVASSLASAVLTFLTKAILERPRPAVVPRLVEVSGLSYPSGHSLASAAVYLTAAFVVLRHFPGWRVRLGGVAFTAGLISSIGVSRVYLGVHYPSDVLGGILLGSAWAVAMGALLRRLDRGVPRGLDPREPAALSREATALSR